MTERSITKIGDCKKKRINTRGHIIMNLRYGACKNIIIIFNESQFQHQVDFDSVLNDTEHVRSVKVTNISPVDVYYTWSFTQHQISFEGKEEDEGMNSIDHNYWILHESC